MSRQGNGTSDYVATTAPVAAGLTRYSYHFFYRNAAAPGTALVDKPFSIADGGGTYDVSFCWDHTASAATLFHREAGGGYQSVSYTGLTNDTWYGLGASYDGVNVKIYLNGALFAFTAAADPSAVTAPTPCALAGSAGGQNFDDGTIAEVAAWTTALSDAEFNSLGKGVAPSLVRPSSLLVYWPLMRDIVRKFGPAITSSGTTQFAHPSMIYPRRRQTADDALPPVFSTYGWSMSHYATPTLRRQDVRGRQTGTNVLQPLLPEFGWSTVEHGRVAARLAQRYPFGGTVAPLIKVDASMTMEDTVIFKESMGVGTSYLGTGRAQDKCCG